MDQTFVFVAQLPLDTTEEKLRAHFSTCGAVAGVQLAKDPTTGKFRGSAFVNFSTSAEAKEAIKTLNGSKLGGTKISVTEPPRFFPDLPANEDADFIRSDFSDETAWQKLKAAVLEKRGEFKANLQIIEDPVYKNITPKQAIELLRKTRKEFLFLVDKEAIQTSDHPILILDPEGYGFRVLAAFVGEVENNLTSVNMDFDEFADAADDNSVFRGSRH